MTPERWRQIEQLLHASLECAPADRIAFLERECGGDLELCEELKSLLSSAQQANSFLEAGPPEAVGFSREGDFAGSLAGHAFGPFSIEKLIGVGGMGE
ncbi:MAG TPA: hypothetical protein VKB46_10075, partial [Pyrinomonadaceae bacterium]|nr:hypothetical protein [Pyrinomonadaceae bacterium]